MKAYIALIAAIALGSMPAAASDEHYRIKPRTYTELYVHFAHLMCGRGMETPTGSDMRRIVPGTRMSCGQAALNQAVLSRPGAVGVEYGSYNYHLFNCEADLILRGKLVYTSLGQMPSSYCRQVAACEVKPGHSWDHFHGAGCRNIAAGD